jgi:ADP-ribose pyrophosphatase YjhB (NUDIX family)
LVELIQRDIAQFEPADERARVSKERMLLALATLSRPFDEHADPTHLTASAIVVGEEGVLLHLHKKLGMWLQPGGHIEAGEAPWDAAAREVLESRDLREAFAGANRSARKMESTLAQVETTFHTAADTLAALHSETAPTAEEARQTLRAFHKTADQAQASLTDVKETLSGADDTRLTATRALEELIHTLQAFRNLAEYLQTHPEAIVIGKERSATGSSAPTEKETRR